MVLNTPSNPDRRRRRERELEQLARACDERDVLLVSDEVYRELYFGERPAEPARDPTAGWSSRRQQGLGSARPARRLGGRGARPAGARARDPRRLLDRRPPARAGGGPGAARELAGGPRRGALRIGTAMGYALDRLQGSVRVRSSPSGRRLDLWLELPAAATADPLGFCYRLRDEAGVLVVPGLAFGDAGRRYLRLSFAAPPEALIEGVRRLSPYWASDVAEREAPARVRR